MSYGVEEGGGWWKVMPVTRQCPYSLVLLQIECIGMMKGWTQQIFGNKGKGHQPVATVPQAGNGSLVIYLVFGTEDNPMTTTLRDHHTTSLPSLSEVSTSSVTSSSNYPPPSPIISSLPSSWSLYPIIVHHPSLSAWFTPQAAPSSHHIFIMIIHKS